MVLRNFSLFSFWNSYASGSLFRVSHQIMGPFSFISEGTERQGKANGFSIFSFFFLWGLVLPRSRPSWSSCRERPAFKPHCATYIWATGQGTQAKCCRAFQGQRTQYTPKGQHHTPFNHVRATHLRGRHASVTGFYWSSIIRDAILGSGAGLGGLSRYRLPPNAAVVLTEERA